jgi:predicted RNase H-like HicB family nuclease
VATLRSHFGKERREEGSAGWDLQIRIEPDDVDGGFTAECVSLPGCVAQGDTIEETLDGLSEAICAVLMIKLEDGVHEEVDGLSVDAMKGDDGSRSFNIRLA